jgi:TRAP-type mannitol/chloroaromatic compound transport system permease small subunit
MRTVFSTLSRLIDSLNDKVGNLVSWLCFSMVIVTFGVVVARYAFNEGSIMVQETVIYMYAFVFMLGAGYTYLNEGHVRVDIFFKNRTRKQQAKINILGNLLLLLPMVSAIFWYSFPYVKFSWSLFEGSKEAGGFDYVYLLKSAIPALCILLGLQAISEIIKNYNKMIGKKSTS